MALRRTWRQEKNDAVLLAEPPPPFGFAYDGLQAFLFEALRKAHRDCFGEFADPCSCKDFFLISFVAASKNERFFHLQEHQFAAHIAKNPLIGF